MNPLSGFKGPQAVFRQPGGWSSFGQVSAQPCFGHYPVSPGPQTAFQAANSAIQTKNIFWSFTGPTGATSCPGFASFGHNSGVTQGLRQASPFPCQQSDFVTPGFSATPPFYYRSTGPQVPVFGQSSGFVQPSTGYIKPAAFQTSSDQSSASRTYVGSRTNNPGNLFEGDRPHVLMRPNKPSITVRPDLASSPAQPYSIRTENKLGGPNSSTKSMGSTSFMTNLVRDSSSGPRSPLTIMPDMETQMDTLGPFTGNYNHPQLGEVDLLAQPQDGMVEHGKISQTTDSKPDFPQVFQPTAAQEPGRPSLLNPKPANTNQAVMGMDFKEWKKKTPKAKVSDVIRTACDKLSADLRLKLEKKASVANWSDDVRRAVMAKLDKEMAALAKGRQEDELSDLGRFVRRRLMSFIGAEIQRQNPDYQSCSVNPQTVPPACKHATASLKPQQPEFTPDDGMDTSCNTSRLSQDATTSITSQKQDTFCAPPVGQTPSRKRRIGATFNSEQLELDPIEEMSPSKKLRLSKNARHTSAVQNCFSSVGAMKQCQSIAYHSYSSTTLSASPMGLTVSRKRKIAAIFCSEPLELDPIKEMSPSKKLRRMSEDARRTYSVQNFSSSVEAQMQSGNFGYPFHPTASPIQPLWKP